MDQYFVTQHGAIRQLMKIRKEGLGSADLHSSLVAIRNDGTTVRGLEEVLLSVRAGRVQNFKITSHWLNQMIFVS